MAGRTRREAAVVVVAGLAVLLSACGASSSSSTGASSPSGTEAGAARRSSSAGSTGAKEGSASFIVPGGDNSIQRFGAEASKPEREAASQVLESYLRARAAKDWQAECVALAGSAVEPLEELVSRGGRHADCATALATIAGSRPGPADPMSGPIGSLRVEGDRAFALFHGNDGVDYAVPMQREGGIWKVGTLEPVELG